MTQKTGLPVDPIRLATVTFWGAMMKRMNDMPPGMKKRSTKPKGHGLSLPQIRMLFVLSNSEGPMTRVALQEAIGAKPGSMLTKALGYSDVEARARFEKTSKYFSTPSLLTRKYVIEYNFDIDGKMETSFEITDAGRMAFERLGSITIPPLKRRRED